MRQIEKLMAAAVAARRPFSLSNTAVSVGGVVYSYKSKRFEPVAVAVTLHNNLICVVMPDGSRRYSCAGWHTTTTRSRLNALGCNCHIHKGRIIDDSGVEIPSSIEF